MTKNELFEKIKSAGIIGAGGAGFPTHIKMADGIDTVLVNAVECEPLVYSDYIILEKHLENVISGAETYAAAMGATQVVIAMKEHTAHKLLLKDEQKVGKFSKIRALPNVYPMGDEIVTIYEATKRLVQPTKLPSSVGVVVINGETAYNIDKAVTENINVCEKWVTIAGDIKQNVVIKVPTYASVSKILDSFNIKVADTHVVVDGGPMMGKIIDYKNAVITKKTKSLLILPKDIPCISTKLQKQSLILKRTSSACCGCRMCTDLCPRHLLGYPLDPAKTLRSVSSGTEDYVEILRSAALCSGCSVCTSIACQQGINPQSTMAAVKNELSKRKIPFELKEEVSVCEDREFRFVPSKRLKKRIGVYEFDTLGKFIDDYKVLQDEFNVNLNDHIGRPSTPIVNVGDKVQKNQMIAKAEDGVSASVHSPINGTVISITNSQILVKMEI